MDQAAQYGWFATIDCTVYIQYVINYLKEQQIVLVCLDVKTTTGVKHMKVYCTTEPDGSRAYSFSQASPFPFFSELNLCVTPNQVMWFY
jgi:hypothetical protein